ncbi:DUF2167 domain-containing protein [Limnoglobus roseus]|uniref:DUF2167 domain-containing protein n=1 Tax=Limnoglobus roseus TaxID=2598579 RepID=A0A5C1AQ09_9BACT|nr:DUF2167 domain-containing protein [Limnoglobus roseus]QEL21080.1 hypothetical protein PX52LOC_08209 [Limnoglobus roseus]
MVGRLSIRLALTGVCLGLAAAIVTAGPHNRGIDEANFQRLTRVGPFSTDIRGKANFRVPTGYRMVVEEKLAEFGELAGFPILGDESGYILMSEKPTWYGIILVLPDDPLKGIDPKTLAEPGVRTQLIEWEGRFHESRRPLKGAAGVPLTVAGWTHPPKYDEKTKVLTMGVRLTSDVPGQKDKVNYQSFVRGPQNTVMLVSAFADVENYDKAEKESGKLAEEFTFVQPPPEEATGEDTGDTMRTAKIAGGGVLGGVVVLLLFKFLGFGAQRRVPVRSGARRPGVRRS